ncbi:MAG TPA: LOG family protein [Dehalococcoidia bacterium]|jgi:uncharacterized protein (TIGR00730 family)|nr:LOG family protein [Dehalococcoidia bacterium]
MTDVRPARRRAYTTRDPELDAKIAELVAAAGESPNSDLLQEMITTAVRLMRDPADRGEMKLVNAALKEFAYSFHVFREYRGHRKVSIFGSARTTPGEAVYEHTRQFAKAMAEHNWMVITGAGPGIMAAGHEGAGAEKSFGASIRLPLESEPNIFIQGNTKLINFKYFFTRKVTFIKESDGFALLPGGFGTMDEAFELLTLMQTGKSDLHPVVLLEEPGGDYWAEWLRFMEKDLVARKLISGEDLHLVYRTESVAAAVEELVRFYANYQSQRYVDGILVLRLLRLPPEEEIEALRTSFADIIGPLGLQATEASVAEIADGDALSCQRLAVDFNQTSVGRLRLLIDALNHF